MLKVTFMSAASDMRASRQCNTERLPRVLASWEAYVETVVEYFRPLQLGTLTGLPHSRMTFRYLPVRKI